MINLKGSLISFGGIEEQAFNDLCIFDIDSKCWTYPNTSGAPPPPREGHAACILGNYMLVYGGTDGDTVFSDMYKLNLMHYKWKIIEQVGDSMGQRHNMGYTLVRNQFYVFGGDPNCLNDLYEITVAQQAKVQKLTPQDGISPPGRHSTSLNNIQDYLILYGGEGQETVLNDVWLFDLSAQTWREIFPLNSINPRMGHAACAFENALYVYGGINDRKKVFNEIAVLQFGEQTESANKEESKEDQSLDIPCGKCGHSNCEFLKRFPSLTHPHINCFNYTHLPLETVDRLANKFHDEFSCLLRISQLMGNGLVSISCNRISKKQLAIEIFNCSLSLTPNEISSIMAGFWEKNMIVPMLKISPVAILISKTSSFLCVAMANKEQSIVAIHFAIFDHRSRQIFPENDSSLNKILSKCHISRKNLDSHQIGTSILLYSSTLIDQADGKIYQNNLSLCDFLTYAYCRTPHKANFQLNGKKINHFSLDKASNAIDNLNTKFYFVDNIDPFGMLVYYKNKLIYWEVHPVKNRKRERNSERCVIIVTHDKKLVSNFTGFINWDSNSKDFLYMVNNIIALN